MLCWLRTPFCLLFTFYFFILSLHWARRVRPTAHSSTRAFAPAWNADRRKSSAHPRTKAIP